MKRNEDLAVVMTKLLRKRWTLGAERKDSETHALAAAIELMRKHKEKANVTDQNIAVLSYLERNPTALIVPDKYTTAAFNAASRAIELEERTRW